MKGLIIKDLFMIVKNFKMYFLLDAFFIIVAFVSPDNVAFLAMPVLISGVIPITLLANDERSNWTKYLGTLPYSKAQIVSAKYLIGLLLQGAMCAVLYAVLLIHGAYYGTLSPAASAELVLEMFAAALLCPTVCLPFCFAFGTEKGRIVYMVTIGAISAAGIAFANSADISEGVEMPEIPPFVWAVILAVYALSWLLSVVVYNKKEVGK